MDLTAQEPDGDALLPAVDPLVPESGDAVGASVATFDIAVESLVWAELGGIRVGVAQQGIGGATAGAALAHSLVVATAEPGGPAAHRTVLPGCAGVELGQHLVSG